MKYTLFDPCCWPTRRPPIAVFKVRARTPVANHDDQGGTDSMTGARLLNARHAESRTAKHPLARPKALTYGCGSAQTRRFLEQGGAALAQLSPRSRAYTVTEV